MKKTSAFLAGISAMHMGIAHGCPAEPALLENFGWNNEIQGSMAVVGRMSDDQTGLLDIDSGRMVIPLAYDHLKLHGDRVVVVKAGKWGIFDMQGKEIVPLKYSGVGYMLMHDGVMAFANDKGKWGFVDKDGKEVLAAQFDQTGQWYKGLGSAQQGEKWGVVNEKGKWVIAPAYDAVQHMENGLVEVVQDGRVGVLDIKGKEILPPHYRNVSLPQDDDNPYIWVIDRGGNTALYDRRGKEILPFVEGRSFDNLDKKTKRLTVTEYVKAKDSYIAYLMDEKGKRVGGLYDEIGRFSEGLVAVGKKEKGWGFINAAGEVVIPLRYQEVQGFFGDLAAVMSDDDLWQLIDRKGKIISKKYDYIALDDFEGAGSHAVVRRNGQDGLIDRSGKEVLPLADVEEVRAPTPNGRFLLKKGVTWQIQDLAGCVYARQGGGKK